MGREPSASYQAELLVLQVLLPESPVGDDAPTALDQTTEELTRFAEEVAGPLSWARVAIHEDPAQAILDAIEQEHVDAVVVGNLGMAGRKQFLLGNVPNRISHSARCTVIIVNSAQLADQDAKSQAHGRAEGGEQLEGMLLRRTWRIGRVMVKAGAPGTTGGARRRLTAIGPLLPPDDSGKRSMILVPRSLS